MELDSVPLVFRDLPNYFSVPTLALSGFVFVFFVDRLQGQDRGRTVGDVRRLKAVREVEAETTEIATTLMRRELILTKPRAIPVTTNLERGRNRAPRKREAVTEMADVIPGEAAARNSARRTVS